MGGQVGERAGAEPNKTFLFHLIHQKFVPIPQKFILEDNPSRGPLQSALDSFASIRKTRTNREHFENQDGANPARFPAAAMRMVAIFDANNAGLP